MKLRNKYCKGDNQNLIKEINNQQVLFEIKSVYSLGLSMGIIVLKLSKKNWKQKTKSAKQTTIKIAETRTYG